MLDPRIYRSGFAIVALALVVLAFSLQDQPGPLGTTLPPDVFNGQNAYESMVSLAASDPLRRPGSEGDDALATQVANSLAHDGFTVSTNTFTGRTVDGSRTLENVTAIRPGISNGSIVVIAHRDALGSPAIADLSGTAALIELARDLAGETLNHTVVLASTSGSAGTAGAIRLASTLGGRIDAVIVLGDLAGSHVREPVVVPWSDGQQVAPPMLRNTVAAALGAQAGLRPGATSMAGQFVHLAFPLTISEQGPFGARGEPAVLLSLSGERGPAADAPVQGPDQITALGRTVLQTISALDGGPAVAAPSSYVLLAGKVVPGWAIELFVLALIVPVLLATVDGLARARRRGHVLWRWVIWVLAGALPFALAALVILGARLTGAIGAAPAGPVGAGAVPLHGAGIAVLAVAGCVLLLSFALLRPLVIRLAGGGQARSAHHAGEPPSEGAGAAVLLVMCLVTIAIWFANPFAAALVVPALHLWMWVVTPQVRLRPLVVLALFLAGLAPPALVVLYYSLTLGFGPLGVAWNAVLLLAGGEVGILAALEWSVVFGCVASVALIALRAARRDRPEQAPVTVRGPITYAGPGSLGGTESALRR
jgi:hypothetical protein